MLTNIRTEQHNSLLFKHITTTISIFLWMVLLGGSLRAQQVDSVVKPTFDSALVQFAISAPMQHASWGFCMVDLHSGEQLYDTGGSLSLMPASTLKPFTSGAVLGILGKDYRFRTMISIGGTVEQDNALNGNLYLEGRGDPTLGSDRFEDTGAVDSLFAKILQALHQNGIHTIHGAVIGDGTWFEPLTINPSWQYEDMGNHYGAGASGLSVYDNVITFIFEPGKRPGDPVKLIGTRPEAPYLEVVNEVTTGPRGSGDRVNVYGAPYQQMRWLRGTIPAGVRQFEVRGTLPDPPFHLAFALHNYLTANGITITHPPTTALRQRWQGVNDTLIRQTLVTDTSPTLSEIVYWVNLRSVNMYTEAIVRAVGKERKGSGTTVAGLDVVMQYWSERGVNLSGLNLKDGSGLSRKNNITAQALAQSLAAAKKEPWYPEFYASFPVAGETGTVAGRFRKTAASGNLRAKSGTLEKVKAFSGYATTASGREVAYSLLINHYSGSHTDLMKEIEMLLLKMCEIAE
jgi:serine-type D-Ala-D-Ala carboxypeptidase/endopeptidase (penicillin-binding protein 4)